MFLFTFVCVLMNKPGWVVFMLGYESCVGLVCDRNSRIAGFWEQQQLDIYRYMQHIYLRLCVCMFKLDKMYYCMVAAYNKKKYTQNFYGGYF